MNTRRAAEIVLRGVLAICACGWGISVFAVFLPPEMAFAHLERLSGRDVDPTPALTYWLRMAGAGFTFIGLLFGRAAIWPDRSPRLTRALLVFQLATGAILLWAGKSSGLWLWSYLNDVLFCLTTGVAGLAALRLRGRR